ncbi:hypothetical protein CDN99_23965 [Roseateles aquatilis]|uniref:TnsE C-terminal domain-containing protein n=2 Tax=Roseateles aquatilis TaxID=431061 RepID=A0A246IYB1_9BURK|nr:hypothetical protein CDN99_23965 [Roseateles aquatilis]
MKCNPDHDFVVWWYGQFVKNPFGHALPHVEALMRRLHSDHSWGGFHLQSFGVTSLPQLRIGSVWRDKRSSTQLAFDVREFSVDFSDGGYDFVSQREHFAKHGMPLLPEGAHPLQNHELDPSQILRLKVGPDRWLLVPCTEFLARCYGRSGKANRLLCQYHVDAARAMMVSASGAPRTEVWPIKIHPGLYKSDAVLLAHLLFDPVTELRARHIYAGIESVQHQHRGAGGAAVAGHDELANGSVLSYWRENGSAHPKVHPWFSGPARLRVEGVEVGDGAFLALRITGCSLPNGPEIEVEYDAALTKLDDGYDDAAEGSAVPAGSAAQGDKIAPLTDISSPGAPAQALEILDPAFEVLGDVREVKVRTVKSDHKSGPKIPATEAEKFSAAERGGGRAVEGARVGYASHHSPVSLERFGTLWAVWRGLKFLVSQLPDQLVSLGWYTTATGLMRDASAGTSAPDDAPLLEPLPITLLADAEASPATKATQRWASMHQGESVTPRGVLIACVETPTEAVFVLELQRRVTIDERGLQKELDRLCGLVVVTERDRNPGTWLPGLLTAIMSSEGIMKKVLPLCPTRNCSDFSHQPPRVGRSRAGDVWARNALDKAGLTLPKLEDLYRDLDGRTSRSSS